MLSSQDRIILFTRYPHPGRCKSRLIPALGKEGAADIHRLLVSHVLVTLHHLTTVHRDIECHIYYANSSPQQMKEWLGNDYPFFAQEGSDLGTRMANCLAHGLKSEKNTLLIGSDCPDITPGILEEGMSALHDRELVLGPAHDGGYYLIGVAAGFRQESLEQLFTGICWGTDTVFQETLDRAEQLGLTPHILTKLHDIDEAEDLKHFHHRPHPG
ncbi:MAG: TIGR04282 family arsenosugar biosynthesis glycosyltransferase [Thermodesulfobacteriota bacterium]